MGDGIGAGISFFEKFLTSHKEEVELLEYPSASAAASPSQGWG